MRFPVYWRRHLSASTASKSGSSSHPFSYIPHRKATTQAKRPPRRGCQERQLPRLFPRSQDSPRARGEGSGSGGSAQPGSELGRRETHRPAVPGDAGPGTRSFEGSPDLPVVQGLCRAPVVHHGLLGFPLPVEAKLSERHHLKDTVKDERIRKKRFPAVLTSGPCHISKYTPIFLVCMFNWIPNRDRIAYRSHMCAFKNESISIKYA